MNVLYLCNSIGRQGTYFRWHNLAIGLTRLGHRVTVAAFDHTRYGSGERIEQRDDVTYRILSGNRGQSLFSQESHPLAAFRGCWRGLVGFDVVHVFQPFLTSALPWMLRRRALAPVVLYDWDDLWAGGLLSPAPRGLAGRWMCGTTGWLERTLPRWVDHVTTCSEYLAQRARKQGARGCTVIHNGFWPASYPSKREARWKLGMREHCFVAGFMGRTITATELDWLAAGLRAAVASRVECRLAVCGFPADQLRSRLGTACDKVDWLGLLSPEQTLAFAAALDVGLLPLEDVPQNRARFPIKFSEYLSAGCTVLMSRVGPCSEIAEGLGGVVLANADQLSWERSFVDTVVRVRAERSSDTSARIPSDEATWMSAAGVLESVYARFPKGNRRASWN